MKKIALSTHFTYKKIILQSLAPILMMIFTSLYTIVDGLFISNIAGPDAFAGMNLIAPLTMIVGGLGFMFGSGGAALASKLLGEKKGEEANKVFAMMIESTAVLVIVVSAISFPFIEAITRGLASLSPDSTEQMIQDGITYGRVLLIGQFIFATQTLFHNFFVANETPNAGFLQTLIGGATNVVFDAIFIAGFKLGVLGAALGTIVGYIAATIYPFIYMYKGKNNLLKIQWCKPNFKVIGKCCTNGLSDFIFTISSAVVSIIYNVQCLKYLGKDGVNAYGAIMYISFIFVAIFIGLVIGMGPIIGYNYGAKNNDELKNVVTKLIILTGIISVCMTVIAEVSADGLALLFTRDETLKALTVKAIRLYAPAFLFSGFGILTTSLFTSLNDGLVSGIISFFRTLFFQIILLIVLPLWFGPDSIWWSIIVVEFLATVMGFAFYFAKRKKYHY